MAAEINERVTKLEFSVNSHESRLSSNEDKIDKMHTSYTGSIAAIEAKVTAVLENNKSMIKLLTYTVIALLTILASIFGVKIADPQLLTGLN